MHWQCLLKQDAMQSMFVQGASFHQAQTMFQSRVSQKSKPRDDRKVELKGHRVL